MTSCMLQIMNNLQNHLTNPCTLRYAKIEVPMDQMEHQLALYEWRRQESGIVSYQWVNIQPYTPKSVLFVLNPLQKLTTLTQITINRLNNISHTLSTIFKAFTRLYSKFGPFEVTAEMITFDPFFDPYVWINKDYIKNGYKREHISQTSMATDILLILKKHNLKIQREEWVNDCQLKGKMSLLELSKYFNDIYEKQMQSKNKRSSQQKILTFNTSNKIKRKKGKNKVNLLVKTTSFSSLRSSQDSLRITIPKPVSSIQLKTNPQFQILGCMNQKQSQYLQVDKKEEQFQMSIQFGQNEQQQTQRVTTSLQRLDSIKHFLVSSINFTD